MEAEFGSACLFFEHVQVIDMPEHNPGQMGGTMRLGKRKTLFQTKNSVMSKSCLPLAGPSARLQDACLGVLLGSGVLGSGLAFEVFSPLSSRALLGCPVIGQAAMWVLERSQAVPSGSSGTLGVDDSPE